MDLDGYLERLKERVQSPKTGPRTLLEERVAPYLPFIAWDNATLERDMQAFWVAVWRHERSHPSGSLIRILEWAKDKSLHPRQVVKALLR